MNYPTTTIKEGETAQSLFDVRVVQRLKDVKGWHYGEEVTTGFEYYDVIQQLHRIDGELYWVDVPRLEHGGETFADRK